MAAILQFIPETGQITRYLTSANTLDYLEADQVTPQSGVLINPMLPAGWSPGTHIVDAGEVRAYTQNELDAQAAAASLAGRQAQRLNKLAGKDPTSILQTKGMNPLL